MSRVAELWRDLGPRGRVGAVGGIVAVLVLLPIVSFAPIVRWVVERRAAERGVQIDVASVRLGASGVLLRGVRVSTEDGRLRGRLDVVASSFSAERIEVHGGFVELTGSVGEIERSLRVSGGTSGSASSRSERHLLVDGIAIAWRGVSGAREHVHRFWGVSFERDGARESADIDLAELSAGGARLTLRDFACGISRQGSRRIETLLVRRADVRLDLHAGIGVGRVPGAAIAPAAGGSAGARATPPPAVAAATESEPLRTALVESVRRAAGFLAPGAKVSASEVSAVVAYGGEELGFGPSRVDVESDAQRVAVAWRPNKDASRNTPLALRLVVPRAAGETSAPRVELEGGPIGLHVLGVRDGDFGLRRVRDATLEAHVNLELGARSIKFSGTGRLANVSLLRPALAATELHGIRLGFGATGEVATDLSALVVENADIAFGDVTLKGGVRFVNDLNGLRLTAKGAVPLASCGAMLSSIPAGLVPALGALKLDGVFSLGFELAYDTTNIEAMRVGLDVKNECRVTYAPAELNPERFRTPWVREVKGADGSMVPIETGPGTDTWVSYENISRNMELAVQVCEDGGFHRHRGFDFRAMEKAIKDNVRAGRFLRGASTISMQLAKNLYLGKEKTLSRKIEEAVLTMLLEQELSKQQILELYLNVIEFGPGIYGIEPAARHYFNQPASELTLSQALYLASILPDPTRPHFAPDGSLTANWAAYIERLIHIAHKVKLITEEERDRALEERVAFRTPASEGSALPSGEVPPPASGDTGGGVPIDAFGGPNGEATERP